MRRTIKGVLLAGLILLLLTCAAAAMEATNFTPSWTTANTNAEVTYDAGGKTYSASYNNDLEGEYALLIVKGKENSYSISEDTITYIDQATASNGKVEFKSFIPMSAPDSVVLLGGDFGQDVGPVVLGTIIGQGYTVSGTVTSDCESINAASAILYDGALKQVQTATMTKNAFEFTSVPDGTYYIVAAMPGHLSNCEQITVSGADITGKTLTVKAGDVDGSLAVDAPDLNGTLKDFNKTAGFSFAGSDVNGDGAINAVDLNEVLKKYNAKATTLPKTT